jgi:hypothetical protein
MTVSLPALASKLATKYSTPVTKKIATSPAKNTQRMLATDEHSSHCPFNPGREYPGAQYEQSGP